MILNLNTGTNLPELTNQGIASDVLFGKQLIDENGNIITGTMADNGDISGSFNGIDIINYTVPAGYTSGGTVSLTDDIPNEIETQSDLIAQIKEILIAKSAYNTVYIGDTIPDDSLGTNGDIYIKRGQE